MPAGFRRHAPMLLGTLLAAACSSAPPPAASNWLEGRVVAPDGSPIADVPVRIYGGYATRWQIGATTTDADGTFRFAQQVEGASRIGEGEQLAFYVGVCAGRQQGSHNPPSYLPWTDVRFADGETGRCTLVLDREQVARKLAELQGG